MKKLDKESVTGISALLVHAANIDENYSDHEKNLIKNSPSKIDLIPIILSGGIGSRLWPLSRSTYPKQYLSTVSYTHLTLPTKA